MAGLFGGCLVAGLVILGSGSLSIAGGTTSKVLFQSDIDGDADIYAMDESGGNV